jgi:hypothetical protein
MIRSEEKTVIGGNILLDRPDGRVRSDRDW